MDSNNEIGFIGLGRENMDWTATAAEIDSETGC
jgi:hypothetical protein